jgi:beta-mannanase
MNYFPGEKYVDIVGLTGYNTGNYYDYEYWREFKEIYDPMLEEYNDYFGYEFIITEFGSNSVGGDKALWIEKMMNEIQKYDIKLAIWFSSIDYDSNGDPARIYLLDENEKILNAFKEGLEKYYD